LTVFRGKKALWLGKRVKKGRNKRDISVGVGSPTIIA
jgi:hypothetical protein